MNGVVVAAGLALLASASAPQHPAVAQENERSYLAAALSVAGLQALVMGGLVLRRSRRRRKESDLLESEKLHRLTLNNISDAVFITAPNGDFRFVCPNVHVIFGCSRAEAEQLGNIRCLLGESAVDALVSGTAGEISNHECTVLDRSGEEHHVLVNVKPVSIRGGTRLYACRDITDRRRAEDAHRKLAQMHRLAGMGELTAMIAHEVNQPLGAILANAEAAELLLEQPEPPLDEVREILEDIRRSDLRADEAIRHIRTLLRPHEIQLAPMSISELVKEVVRLVAGDASRRHIRICTDMDPALPLASGDAIHLQHVVLNLVINAMDAMAVTPPELRQLNICASLDRESIHLEVTDRGPGIAAGKLATIFDSFFTTKANGMGLGLPIAQSIITAHHGQIWAENNEQGGATFHFTLQVAANAAGAAA